MFGVDNQNDSGGFTYDGSDNPSQYNGSGTNAYTYDPQGSTVQTGESTLVGQSQYALNTLSYDGFGALTGSYSSSSGSHPATHRDASGFGGQYGYYQDLQTGLEHLGARYYDGGTGRFVTRDPIGYGGGENLYAFCGNNPINESDPSGTDVYAYIFYGNQGKANLGERLIGTHAMSAVDSPIGPITISYAGILTLRVAHGKYKLDLSSLGSVYSDHGTDALNGEAYRITTTPAEDAIVLRQLAQWRGVSVEDLLGELKASSDGEIMFSVKGHNDGSNLVSYSLGLDNCASFTSAVIAAAGVKVNHNPLLHLGDFYVPDQPFGREGRPCAIYDELFDYCTNGDADHVIKHFPVHP